MTRSALRSGAAGIRGQDRQEAQRQVAQAAQQAERVLQVGTVEGQGRRVDQHQPPDA